MISLSLARYVLKGALRDKVYLAVLVGMIVGVSLSILSASAAITEQDQFSLVFMAGGLRLLGLAGLILFVVFFVRRSFDARDVDYLLTRPISRLSFVLSHSFAFTLLAGGIAVTLGVGVVSFAMDVGKVDGALLWATGVVVEFVILANLAFFFAMVLSSPVSAGLATAGFYVLGRLMGQILGVIYFPTGDIPGFHLLAAIMKMISMVTPRFDLLAQTSWLLYGAGADLLRDYAMIAAQGFVFLSLVITATVIDLVRREF